MLVRQDLIHYVAKQKIERLYQKTSAMKQLLEDESLHLCCLHVLSSLLFYHFLEILRGTELITTHLASCTIPIGTK